MKNLRTVVLRSDSLNPHYNLATEEWLFRKRTEDQFVLFLYRNAPSVVIGRNQNPWLELDLPQCDRQTVQFARRISGGGAVYHDEGNLNYSFIMPRPLYDPTTHLEIIVEVLQSYGIQASINARHNILAADCKLSGTAFMLSGPTALQHGTLLVAADLDVMAAVLTPACTEIQTKTVRSVPAKVINLRQLQHDLTTDDVEKRLAEQFRKHYGGRGGIKTLNQATRDAAFATHLAKHQSYRWLYGRTPAFVRELHGGTDDGDQWSLQLTVRKAVMDHVSFSGHMSATTRHKIENAVIGKAYDERVLEKHLRTAGLHTA